MLITRASTILTCEDTTSCILYMGAGEEACRCIAIGPPYASVTHEQGFFTLWTFSSDASQPFKPLRHQISGCRPSYEPHLVLCRQGSCKSIEWERERLSLGCSRLLTCIEFPDVLLVPKQRLQLSRQAVELQTVLKPELCNGAVADAVWGRLSVLMQTDKLGGAEDTSKGRQAGYGQQCITHS